MLVREKKIQVREDKEEEEENILRTGTYNIYLSEKKYDFEKRCKCLVEKNSSREDTSSCKKQNTEI